MPKQHIFNFIFERNHGKNVNKNYRQLKFLMAQPQIIKIDESVKISSWANNYPSQDSARQQFQKYAQGPILRPDEESPEDPQIILETGFRKLKNEQIEKLKDLRSQYEEIRKISTADYAFPRQSRTPSLQSSSRQHSQAQPAGGKGTGRELQILELEKKQLEIMVENSMKKIEQLLHNQMSYKKTIHELRLTRDARTSSDLDPQGLTRLLKKKEREFQERVKLLQLERDALAGSLTGARDRIKYLEGSLSASEQQLRRLLQQKRTTEEQLRLERDRFLSLEIDLRRERREHQISEKDKTAQINRLLKLRDLKESSSERELKNALSTLQEEVKVKEQRYRILLEKFEVYQREQRERHEQKENEARAVTELLSKSSAPDPQSRLLQETITGILTRLNDLEKKPLIEIDNIVNHEHEEHSETVQRLEQKISQLSSLLSEKNQQITDLQAQNQKLKNHQEKLDRDISRLTERDQENTQELERLKKLQKTFRKDKSSERFTDLRPRTDFPTSTPSVDSTRLLEARVNSLTKENEKLIGEKNAFEEENRQLRLTVSRLEFEVEKGSKQKAFALALQEKAFQKRIDDMNIANLEVKSQIAQINSQRQRTVEQTTQALVLKTQEVIQLRNALEALQLQRSSVQVLVKQSLNSSINRLQSQNNQKLAELTSTIQQLTAQNLRLQQQREQWSSTLEQNQQLVEMLKRTRFINTECDRLWSQKEQHYQKLHQVLALTKP